MTTFLLSILPVSLWIFAVNILFQEGHLLERVGDWMLDYWPEWITKPLFDCPICMASIHGTLWFAGILPYFFSVQMHIKFWILFMFCLCGLNTIILGLTSKKRIIQEFETEAFRQLHDLTKKAA